MGLFGLNLKQVLCLGVGTAFLIGLGNLSLRVSTLETQTERQRLYLRAVENRLVHDTTEAQMEEFRITLLNHQTMIANLQTAQMNNVVDQGNTKIILENLRKNDEAIAGVLKSVIGVVNHLLEQEALRDKGEI